MSVAVAELTEAWRIFTPLLHQGGRAGRAGGGRGRGAARRAADDGPRHGRARAAMPWAVIGSAARGSAAAASACAACAASLVKERREDAPGLGQLRHRHGHKALRNNGMYLVNC